MSSRIVPNIEWASAGEVSDAASSSSAVASTNDLPAMTSAYNKNRLRSMSHGLSTSRLSLVSDQAISLDKASTRGHARSRSVNVAVKGIIRRASMSLKGMVQHQKRHSVAHPSGILEDSEPSRPVTAHSTWQRLRQAAHRSQRTSHGAELERPRFTDSFQLSSIPQNESALLKHGSGSSSGDFGTLHKNISNDCESGIGMMVSGADDSDTAVELDEAVVLDQDAEISRVDFVRQLPVELSIQILAYLNGPGLIDASLVSHRWQQVVESTHVWRESFLTHRTGTYATGRNITPGTGLGVPHVTPDVDWKDLFRIRQELDQNWKTGTARPVYLNGHQESIYCLQFDEYVGLLYSPVILS